MDRNVGIIGAIEDDLFKLPSLAARAEIELEVKNCRKLL